MLRTTLVKRPSSFLAKSLIDENRLIALEYTDSKNDEIR